MLKRSVILQDCGIFKISKLHTFRSYAVCHIALPASVTPECAIMTVSRWQYERPSEDKRDGSSLHTQSFQALPKHKTPHPIGRVKAIPEIADQAEMAQPTKKSISKADSLQKLFRMLNNTKSPSIQLTAGTIFAILCNRVVSIPQTVLPPWCTSYTGRC